MKPNVLLLMVDQMRADCLSIREHPVVDTPNLDQLARDGVLFENAYTATPSCVPARASVLTGMSQASTGRVGYQDKVPWDYDHTIAGAFSKAGYQTQAIGKMHVYPTRQLCGFHNVILHDGYMHYNRFKHHNVVTESFDYVDDYLQWMRGQIRGHVDITDLGLDCNSATVTRPWHLSESLHPTNWLTTESIDFLRRRDPTKPFFLKMSYVRPHPPFDPPAVYDDMYRDMDMPPPPVGDWAETTDEREEGLSPIPSKGIVPEHRLKRAQAAYYALITQIDHQIGRFLNALHEHGEYDNTIILFVSDHGELLGDHHLFRKSLPYEGSAKIPFILTDPGNHLNIPPHTRREEVVELSDIMPTLLDAVGADIPGTVEGRSVLDLFDTDTSTPWRTHIHGEHEMGERSFHYITDGKEKYVWFSQTGHEQFFDLQKDPTELSNRINDDTYVTTIQTHRDRLMQALQGREEGYTDGTQLITGQQAKPTLNHLQA